MPCLIRLWNLWPTYKEGLAACWCRNESTPGQAWIKHGPAIYYQGIMKMRSWMFQMVHFDVNCNFEATCQMKSSWLRITEWRHHTRAQFDTILKRKCSSDLSSGPGAKGTIVLSTSQLCQVDWSDTLSKQGCLRWGAFHRGRYHRGSTVRSQIGKQMQDHNLAMEAHSRLLLRPRGIRSLSK